MTITFVSAFIDSYEKIETGRSPLSRMNHFKKLADVGINIHLFLSRSFKTLYEENVGVYKTIFVEYIDLDELITFQEMKNVSYNLPFTDNPLKDTANYHIIINAKIEFVEKAIRQNIFPSPYYAWIDFSIGHVFKNTNETLKYLQNIASNENLQIEGMFFPGCWPIKQGINDLLSKVNWRFCGGFFVGDHQSLLNFYQLYRSYFRSIVEKNRMLPWEVNIWHYLEIYEGFSPKWYAADHDDSILRFTR